jgi:FkbM family methyltransferase
MLIKCLIITILILLILSVIYWYKKCNYTTTSSFYKYTENPYYNGQFLLWLDESNLYAKQNHPANFTWDKKIKQHIVDLSKNLPINYSIIDCGAHIGDGAIPIAAALSAYGREDIIVYAIEPDKDKINFIKDMAIKNNLSNLRTIECGLSNDIEKYNSMVPNYDNNLKGINSGGTFWEKTNILEVDKNKSSKYTKTIQVFFEKLDNLIENGTIPEKIGYIHLDVEGMEKNAILGSINTIKRDSPILSLEEANKNSRELKDILEPLGYVQKYRLESNNIYERRLNLDSRGR